MEITYEKLKLLIDKIKHIYPYLDREYGPYFLESNLDNLWDEKNVLGLLPGT